MIIMFLINFLQEALDAIQISKENQKHLFSILAAVLWLGNICFSVVDNENHVEVVLGEGTLFIHGYSNLPSLFLL